MSFKLDSEAPDAISQAVKSDRYLRESNGKTGCRLG